MAIINTIGRNKTSTARLYLRSGQGEVKVNKRAFEDYFPIEELRVRAYEPIKHLGLADQYSIQANVNGGGLKGQSYAIRLALARALCEVDPSYRTELKKEGYLTRDPRMVERKKYGQKKARKKFQFSKR